MNLLTPKTQVLKSGRQVVINFPADEDADEFMQALAILQSTPMIIQAAFRKPKVRPPESIWSLILEALSFGR